MASLRSERQHRCLAVTFWNDATPFSQEVGNLLLGGHLDIAVRDVVLLISPFTLARLTRVRDELEIGHAGPAAGTGST